ncbi:hypothetical protein STSP2_01629 [Anaerohalosphaera lusitana]|uniref:DUF58 domain-containing protein n=1 Tax=Anaerohalosphaera lusitana TaxID=1936003 RepID=A0A1U9NKX2_9BACT|nr:DUF58 domain-containing protein [Anaerohalosphaera lusitana]AQT68465.1 hypothetical protein STSP2_01629 [Anaerohalosphaera lusitana]
MKSEYRDYLLQGQQAGLRYALFTSGRISQGLAGSNLGSRAGSSLEFMEHRNYMPGDDLRHIDWGVFARSDRLCTKMFREEISPHVEIVIDGSRSMGLAGSEKARACLGLAGLLAQASINSQFTFSAWQTGDFCEKIVNGSESPAAWDGLELESIVSPGEAFKRYPPHFRPRSIRVLISDLFWVGDPRQSLMSLAANASDVVILQLVARRDVEPGDQGSLRLIDSETGQVRELFVDDAAMQRYEQNFSRHQQNWRRACTEFGGRMVTLVAEDVVKDWHLPELIESEILGVA